VQNRQALTADYGFLIQKLLDRQDIQDRSLATRSGKTVIKEKIPTSCSNGMRHSATTARSITVLRVAQLGPIAIWRNGCVEMQARLPA